MGHDRRLLRVFAIGLLLAFSSAVDAQPGQGTLSGTWILKELTLDGGKPLPPYMQTELKFHRIVISGENSGTFSSDQLVMFEDAGKPTITCHDPSESTFTVVRTTGHNVIRFGAVTLHPAPDCGRYAGTTGNVPAGATSTFVLAGDTLTFSDDGGGDGLIRRVYKRVHP